MCAEKFPLVSMGGRAEGFACADPGARTPIDASGISQHFSVNVDQVVGPKLEDSLNFLENIIKTQLLFVMQFSCSKVI